MRLFKCKHPARSLAVWTKQKCVQVTERKDKLTTYLLCTKCGEEIRINTVRLDECALTNEVDQIEKELVKAWDIIRLIKDFNILDAKSRSKATWFLKRHKNLVQKTRNEQGSSDE